MLILKKDDIKKCFTMRDAIEADKEALEIYSEGKAKVPLRTNIEKYYKKAHIVVFHLSTLQLQSY